MSNVDVKLLKELRAMTHAPLKDCKEALEESNGDLDAAHEYLKKKGALKAAKKADRQTNEGIVCVRKVNGKVVALALACETDFVAKNESFKSLASELVDLLSSQVDSVASYDDLSSDMQASLQKLLDDNQLKIGENMKIVQVEVSPLATHDAYIYVHPGDRIAAVVYFDGDEEVAKGVALQVAAMNPTYFSSDDVPAEDIEKMKVTYREELKNSPKPADIQEKIIEGKLQKDLSEVVLLEQVSIVDDSKKVKDTLRGTAVVGYSRYAI